MSSAFAAARLGLLIPAVNTQSEPQFYRYAPDDLSIHVMRARISGKPDLQLDALMGQRAGSERLLQEQAGRIASRASYIAEFAFHDEFHPERTKDGRAVDGDDYDLLLHDPEGSLEEKGIYGDTDAEEDAGVSPDPKAARGEPSMSRRGAGDA